MIIMKRLGLGLFLSACIGTAIAQPQIVFDNTTHDFGSFEEEIGPVTHEFKFFNTGNEPLLITNVRTTCGCTASEYTREPIAPNDSGSVKVTYNPKGRPGRFSKPVYVTTNASEGRETLHIKGVVIGTKSHKITNPYKIGDLSLRSLHIPLFETAKGHLKEGQDVLFLCFSSGLSSTRDACAMAAEDLRERYPDRKIYTVDTLAASGGQGLLVLLAGRKRKAGASIEEVRDFAEETKLHVGHWFTVDDLVYLKRGGRVSSAAAVVGTMLNIKPVLHVDNEGHLISMEKVRGRKAAIQALFRHMQETALPNQETVLINHADCLPEAQALAEQIQAAFHPKEVLIADLGPIIGAHTGPGLVTLFFLAEHR